MIKIIDIDMTPCTMDEAYKTIHKILSLLVTTQAPAIERCSQLYDSREELFNLRNENHALRMEKLRLQDEIMLAEAVDRLTDKK